MFIELTEILFCPACRPGQGLVARVDRLESRRIVEGFLGCPVCEARYPIQEGTVRFEAGPSSVSEPSPAAEAGAEPAAVVAALLGLLPDVRGYFLLGPALASAAPGLAAIGCSAELVVLGAPGVRGPEPAGEVEGRLSRLEGLNPESLPFFSSRFRGIALASASPAAVAEAARLLQPGGRLVLLAPSEEAVRAVERAPLELLVSEPRALVAAGR